MGGAENLGILRDSFDLLGELGKGMSASLVGSPWH
jgi:hypothetical protein